MLSSYKELKVWQRSIELVEEVYVLTNRFPKEEVYGLSLQMRRSAVSIPSNIAEGQRRKDLPEYLQFLRIADASSAELETQVIISKRLYQNLDYSKTDSLLEEVQKMLNVLLRKLSEKSLKPKTQNLKPKQGVAALPAIIIVGGLMVEIGIAGLVLAFLLTNAGFGVRLSSEALGAARAGVSDAFVKIARNKDFSNSGYTVTTTLRSSAFITVLKDQPSSGKHKVTSLGSALTRRRQLEAVVETNAGTGEVRMEYLREISL